MYVHRPGKKKKVYGQNIQLIEDYRKISKDDASEAAIFKHYKDGRYEHMANLSNLQTEIRKERLTESPNTSKNRYDVLWDNAKVGDELKLIGHGKHPRDVHLGKTNNRDESRDWSSTAKRRKKEGKTYMCKSSKKLMPAKEVYFIVF